MENPKNLRKTSIHEGFQEAVKSRATMAYKQGRGHVCIHHMKDPDRDPWNASIGVISVEQRRHRHRHRHRQRHGGIRNKERNPNNDENDINDKNDKIGMDGRNVTKEHRFFELSNHFPNFFVKSVDFFRWTLRVQTLANVVHATESEDRTPHQTQRTRIFFSLRAV